MADGNTSKRVFLRKVLYRIDFQFITEQKQEDIYSYIAEKYGDYFSDRGCEQGNAVDIEINTNSPEISSVIRASQATSVENIDEKLMALQQELIQKAQNNEAYDEIANEIFRLRELRQQTTVDTVARDEQIKRINDLQDYISQQTAHLTKFDESLVRRWVKQITI